MIGCCCWGWCCWPQFFVYEVSLSEDLLAVCGLNGGCRGIVIHMQIALHDAMLDRRRRGMAAGRGAQDVMNVSHRRLGCPG